MVLATELPPTQAAITIRKLACPVVFIAYRLIGTTVDAAVRVGRAICQILIGQVQMKKTYIQRQHGSYTGGGPWSLLCRFFVAAFSKA